MWGQACKAIWLKKIILLRTFTRDKFLANEFPFRTSQDAVDGDICVRRQINIYLQTIVFVASAWDKLKIANFFWVPVQLVTEDFSVLSVVPTITKASCRCAYEDWIGFVVRCAQSFPHLRVVFLRVGSQKFHSVLLAHQPGGYPR